MQTGVVTREFSFNGLKLPDPDPKLTVGDGSAGMVTKV